MNDQRIEGIGSERFQPPLQMSGNAPTQKRVLCATDLSPRSQLAVGRAMHLAKRLDARVILLHVVDPAESTVNSMYARDEIARQLGSVRVTGCHAPQIHVRAGDYVEGIAAVAEETDANVIVLGAPTTEGSSAADWHHRRASHCPDQPACLDCEPAPPPALWRCCNRRGTI
jgi:nucleotide-binding universal stress UspA family protein